MPAPSKGELFELRVARLLDAEGAFVRRRVNLDQQVGGRLQVTDLDVLAFFFDDTLRLRLVSGECKTAETKNAPSTKDRLLWLAGVSRLVEADDGFLATIKGARDVDRHFARSLTLDLVDSRDLARREGILGLAADSGAKAHSEDSLALEREADTSTVKDEELRRVYFFVRSELWLGDPVTALKRALGALRVLGQRWSPKLGERERRILRWLTGEAICGLSVSLVRLAGESYRSPEDVFAKHLNERLAEGLASYDAMREIAKQVDKFLIGVLREAGVDDNRVVGAIGALAPRPPGYSEPLLELIQRLAAEPRLTRELPRLAERYFAGDLYGESLIEADGARLLRLVAAFVERQGRLPAELVAPLKWRPSITAAADDDAHPVEIATNGDGEPTTAPQLFTEQT
jgi:hypothetical protein